MLHNTTKSAVLARVKKISFARNKEIEPLLIDVQIHPRREVQLMHSLTECTNDLNNHYASDNPSKTHIGRRLRDLNRLAAELHAHFQERYSERPIEKFPRKKNLEPTPPSLYNEFAQASESEECVQVQHPLTKKWVKISIVTGRALKESDKKFPGIKELELRNNKKNKIGKD